MIRQVALLAAAALAIVAGVEITSFVLAGTDPLAARFGQADCRRVALVDAGTGRRISGAEDLALAPGDGALGETLIVSAHDRRDPASPDGGLYAVPVGELAAANATIAARPLVDPDAKETPFRPHGIALAPDGDRLALVNRVGPREAVVEIGRLDDAGWHPEAVIRDPALCRANDLAFEGGGDGNRGDAVLVTIDRADCGTAIRDLLPGARTGSVARIEDGALRMIRADLAFPNGIAAGPELGTVAETRAGRLLGPEGREIVLPGAPDNLTPDGDALVAAVHPDLTRLWLHRMGLAGSAPTRIVRIGADGPDGPEDTVETLFDDPSGALFSGATVGLLADGRLIAGSATDSGLLVCGDPA